MSRSHKRSSRVRRMQLGCEQLEHRLVLSTFNVNTTLDTVAVNLQSGKDATGHISLRSAIMAADAHGGSNTIKVPAGTFMLTIAGADEDAGATGDLDVKGNVTIQGKGAASTIIDGNHLDRVLEVLSGNVTISGVTIQNGRAFAEGGGGIFNAGGKVTLSAVQVLNNVSVGIDGVDGGNGGPGIPGGTASEGSIGEGGGIFNAAGSLSLVNTPGASTFLANHANGGAGGSGGTGGNASAANGGDALADQSRTGGAGGEAVAGNGGFGAAGLFGDGGGLANGEMCRSSGSPSTSSAIWAPAAPAAWAATAAPRTTTATPEARPSPAMAAAVGWGLGAGAFGGGIAQIGGTLTIKPRLGAKNGSAQASAINMITTNQANHALGGGGGARGSPPPVMVAPSAA